MFTQLIIGLITLVICAVMMQDQSMRHTLACNHSYSLFPSVSCVSAVCGLLEMLSVTQRQPVSCVCFRVHQCVFGDICVAELLMQCKSNLSHGRCGAVCYVCVFVFVFVCVRHCQRGGRSSAVIKRQHSLQSCPHRFSYRHTG